MSENPKKKSNLLKRLILFSLAIFAFLILLGAILFYIFKDDIGRKIIEYSNEIQEGDLEFEDISFAPFIHFPNMSIDLEGIKYFEKKDVYRYSDSIPIIELHHLYLAIDLINLVKGNVNVSKVSLVEGMLNIVTYSDSSLNLINAIGSTTDSTQINSDSLNKVPTDFELDLNKISLENIRIKYKNIQENNESAYNIKSLTASLNYSTDTIKCHLTTHINIEETKFFDGFILKDKMISLETSLKFNRQAKQLIVDPSKFSFEQANFATSGSINFTNTGFINLDIKGNDKDFSILDLFLTEKGVENIKAGNLYFNGNIKGMLFKDIPKIDVQFGLDNVTIQIPNTNEQISNLNISGEFHSGEKKDFSGAHLSIAKLEATLPGGKLDATLDLTNFVSPEVDLDFYIKSNVTGFEHIFALGEIDNLTGIIEIKTHLNGKYNSSEKIFKDKSGKSIFKFDSLSFLIPNVNSISNIYGRVEQENDTTFFKDLNLEIGKSDFNINGDLSDVLYIFFNAEKKIDGRLHIKSNTFDYPDFFTYDQRTAEAFPYQIKNVDLFVNPSTTTSNLTEFINAPEIIFDIDHLEAEVEEFLPPLVIQSGIFTLGDKDSSLNLDFANFNIDVAGSKLLADFVYNSPESDPPWLTTDIVVSDLNPKNTFVHWFAESVPEYLDGRLDAEMNLELVISNDSSMDFDKLDFKALSLDFINSMDTLHIHKMRVNTKNIAYDLSSSQNILENLSFDMNLSIDTITTNYFKVDKVEDDITAENGEYQIIPNNGQFFDKKAESLILLKPFQEPPSYEFNYKVEQFDVAALFETFMEETRLLGKMDIDFQLIFSGEGWEEVKENLKGEVNAYGQDLTMLGMDLDKVIDRFKRSQHFTFADVGAIFLMGPAGLLVTKGSDYASLVVLNHGDSSHIVEISSKWEINNGLIDLTDVAFSTDKNRMAAIGGIDIGADTLNVQFALINDQGCSVFSQDVTGSLEEPKMGKVRVVKSLFSPVTKLVNSVDGKKCEMLYNGIVKPPQSEKK